MIRGLAGHPPDSNSFSPDPRRDEWQTKTLSALKKIPLKSLVKEFKESFPPQGANRFACWTEQSTSQKPRDAYSNREKTG